jgi:O-antigen/teichoic acid export membrane protein
MPPTLKQKTVSGFKWLVINHFGQRVIRVVSVAILARILDPSVFGLFAMAFIAIDGFSLFKSFGVDGALIQRKATDPSFETAKHTAFFLIQFIGIAIFLAFQIAAPWIGLFLKNQEVVTIMRVLGAIFIVGNLGRIPNALLTKQMRFKLLSTIELVTSVLNSVCSVIFAFLWPNVWSLVLAYLVKQIFNASATWYYERFKVKLIFDWKIAKELFHYGKFMVGMGLLGYIAFNLDNVLISRYLGPAMLGYFVLAENITSFTHQQVMQHIGRVLFPAISTIQDDPAMIKRAYLKAVRFISIVAIPFSVGIAVVAKDFVLALYGEKWLDIVPLIQLLAISQIVNPLLGCAGAVFMGCNKPKYSYYLQLSRLLVKVPLVIVMMKQFGLLGVVYTHMILEFSFGAVIYILVQRLVKFPVIDFIKQLVPSAICTFVMVGVILIIKSIMAAYPAPWLFEFHHVLPLFLFAAAGLPAYIGAFYLIDRAAVKEVFALILPGRKTA